MMDDLISRSYEESPFLRLFHWGFKCIILRVYTTFVLVVHRWKVNERLQPSVAFGLSVSFIITRILADLEAGSAF